MRKILISLSIAVIIIAGIIAFSLSIPKQEDNAMLVFIEIEANDTDIEVLKKQISDIDGVHIEKYKTKEDIKEEMLDESKDMETIFLEYEGELPFNPIFVLNVSSKLKLSKVSMEIKKLDNVYEVIYEGENS